MSRRWRGVGHRRGEFLQVPPAAAAPAAPSYPPAFTEQAGSRPRGRPTPRRGAFHDPPWAVAAPAAPPWPPALITRARARVGLARGGRVYGSVPAVVAAPSTLPGWVRARQKPLSARCGAFHEPPWAQGPQNVWTPAIEGPGRRARWLPPARRGELLVVPPAPVAAAPSVWVPGLTQAARRLAGRPSHHGRLFEPPTAAAAPAAPAWPPERVRSRRPRPGLVRRGQFQPALPRPAGVPAFLRRRRPTPWLRCRQGYSEPPWVQGPQTVWRPPWRPQAGARPRFAARLRRGRYQQPPWPQGVQAPLVRAWEGAGGSRDTHDAAGGLLATREGTGGQLAAHEATGGSGDGHEGSGGTATTWEGG